MLKNPKITVIMPTFNRAGLISKSIESVLNQTFKDFEFYILDDGSNDNTKEVVEPYLKDNRVKYLYHKNQGEAETVNLGWSLAKGEYFTQVNSDDTIALNSFEIMVKELDKHKKCVLAYPDFNFIDENDNIISTTRSPDWNFKKALLKFSCYAASAGTFIRKNAFRDLEKIKRSRFKHINDIEMYWDMALRGDFLHVPKVLANWRVHSGQISTNRYEAIPEIEEWFEYYFSKSNLPKDVKKLKDRVRQSILKYFFKLIIESSLDEKTKFEMKKSYLKKFGLPCYEFRCLQIGETDLKGNKFNGYNLSKYLKEKGIGSKCLVSFKESNNKDVFEILMPKIGNKHEFSVNFIKNELILEADIINFHICHSIPFDLNYLPLLTALKPVILTLHDPSYLTGYCCHPFNCEKWKKHCNNCKNLNTWLPISNDYTAHNFLTKKLAIQNSNICAIAASDYIENMVKQSPIWQGKKIYKVPFGVNQEIFKPADDKSLIRKKLGINKDSIVLMARTNDGSFKGIEHIKNALKNLKTDKKITVLTVEKKGLLEEFKNKFEIKEYAWVYDDNKLAELYQASDIFLMPSNYESFGMMAIEAMSSGVPVLSIKGTSLESVTNSPECGLSVEPSEFACSLQDLIDNPDEIKRRGEKSLSFAKEHYNKDTYVHKIIEVYKEVIEEHKKNQTEEEKITIEQLKNMLLRQAL